MDGQSYKVILVGDTGVGKSSIVHRYIYGKKPPTMRPTIGAAYYLKEYTIDNKTIRINIWDTAGQEKFRSLVNIYYKQTKGCVCVFDITRRNSFENLNHWIGNYKRYCNINNGKVIVVANKCDYDKSLWCVTEDEIIQLCQEHDCQYVFTSSFNGQGIDEIFIKIIEEIVECPLTQNPILDENANKGYIVELTSKIIPKLPTWC